MINIKDLNFLKIYLNKRKKRERSYKKGSKTHKVSTKKRKKKKNTPTLGHF